MKRLFFAALLVAAAACGTEPADGPGTTVPTTPTPTSTTTTLTLPGATQRDLLIAARTTWLANRPASYALTYAISCECDGGPWFVHVDGTEAVVVERLGIESGRAAPHRSVESIFDEIESALDAGEAPINATYNNTLGFPREFIFNEPELPVDGGFVLRVIEFEADPRPSNPGQRDAFASALQKWQDAGLTDYDYSFTRGCFCPEEFVGPYAVSVREEAVEQATFKGTDLFDISILEIGRYEEIVKTVDGVFEEIERALRQADSFTADYDPVLGYPTNVYIDWIANAADEEVGYTIRSLRDPAAYPETCSTEAWEAELTPQPGLPEPVAATRMALFEAAMSCDFDGIGAVSDSGDRPVETSHGGSGPEFIWEREAEGIPSMRTLVEHLNLSFAASEGSYVWPSAMVDLTSPYGEGLSGDDYTALLEQYTVEDLEEMFEFFDGFVGYRIVIAADGQWRLFIAGD